MKLLRYLIALLLLAALAYAAPQHFSFRVGTGRAIGTGATYGDGTTPMTYGDGTTQIEYGA